MGRDGRSLSRSDRRTAAASFADRPDVGGGGRPADRLREPRESPHGARDAPVARNRATSRARRRPRTHDPHAPHREPLARLARRYRRRRPRLRAASLDSKSPAAVLSTGRSKCRHGRPGARVPRAGDDPDERGLRPFSGAENLARWCCGSAQGRWTRELGRPRRRPGAERVRCGTSGCRVHPACRGGPVDS